MQVNVPVPLSVWEMHFWDAFFSTALESYKSAARHSRRLFFLIGVPSREPTKSEKRLNRNSRILKEGKEGQKMSFVSKKSTIAMAKHFWIFCGRLWFCVAFLGVVSKNVWLVTRALLKSSRICFPTWRIIPVSKSLIRGGCRRKFK